MENPLSARLGPLTAWVVREIRGAIVRTPDN